MQLNDTSVLHFKKEAFVKLKTLVGKKKKNPSDYETMQVSLVQEKEVLKFMKQSVLNWLHDPS